MIKVVFTLFGLKGHFIAFYLKKHTQNNVLQRSVNIVLVQFFFVKYVI